MNNLKTLRDFFQLGATEVSQALQITVAELNNYESGHKQPEILMWQRFAEYYADKFHVDALPDHTELIHGAVVIQQDITSKFVQNSG